MHAFQHSVSEGTRFGLPVEPAQVSMSENSIGIQIGYFF
jgi:hypothetical protein